tara:strand:- start:4508 stop:5056 length:549 start_codon:yes stop_codon:yes gene_type:complete
MAYTKSEVDEKNSKEIQDKGQDRVIKEISNLKQEQERKFVDVYKKVGLNEDGTDTVLGSLGSLAEQLGGKTIKTYDSGWVSINITDTGSSQTKILASSVPFNLLSGINMIQHYWKWASNQIVIINPSGMEFGVSEGVGVEVESNAVKLNWNSVSANNHVYVNDTILQWDEANYVKTVIINLS